MPTEPHGRGPDLLPLRTEGSLARGRRSSLLNTRSALLAELAMLDADAQELARRRVEVVAALRANRDELWPRVPWCRGRRPPTHDQPSLPPAPAGAMTIGGRRLRRLCLHVLSGRGPLTLAELHGAIHLQGYLLESRRPVQALADAIAYEVKLGHAVRHRRGVYGVGHPPAAGPGMSGRGDDGWSDGLLDLRGADLGRVGAGDEMNVGGIQVGKPNDRTGVVTGSRPPVSMVTVLGGALLSVGQELFAGVLRAESEDLGPRLQVDRRLEAGDLRGSTRASPSPSTCPWVCSR